MNRTYHPACFLCRQCRHPLAGELYYNKAGTPLCEPCYQATLEQCGRCGQVIQDQVIRALDKAFHPACFTCVVCSQPIGAERFAVDDNNELHCLLDYYRRFASRCCVCEQLIIPAPDGRDLYTVECLGRSFHEACYCCQVCGVQLSPEPTDQGCFPLDDRILCKPCHINLAQQSTP
ncbi:FBLI1 protein, partial [Amia calva]|nr:FBLI1 protein [Amia calva]